MKHFTSILPLLVLLLTLSSCDVIQGIFNVGFWVGIVVVLLVIGLIFWIVRKLR